MDRDFAEGGVISYLSEPVLYRRVHQLVRLYGLTHFIETGCGPECDGLRTSIALRLRGYSCDINPRFVEEAQRVLGGPQTAVTYGESLDGLAATFGWLEPRDAPSLFFLDAHFPEYEEYGNQNVAGVPRFPLLDELKFIKHKKQGVAHDVILCDDMRCIEDLQNPRWDPKEMEGSPLVQRGVPFKEYTSVFAVTHSWSVWTEFEGVLAFTPRGEK